MYQVTKYNKEKIRAARLRQGWTRRYVAGAAKVAESTLHRLETKGQGHVDTVRRILGVLGLRIEDTVIDDDGSDEKRRTA